MTTQTVTVAQARSDFSNLLGQVELLNRRFVIARRGKPKAALISIKDLARLEALAGTNTAPRLADRERAIQALQQAGLIRPVSGELVDRYAPLEADEREAIRTQLAERRFDRHRRRWPVGLGQR